MIEITDEMVEVGKAAYINDRGNYQRSARALLKAVAPMIREAVIAEAQEAINAKGAFIVTYGMIDEFDSFDVHHKLKDIMP